MNHKKMRKKENIKVITVKKYKIKKIFMQNILKYLSKKSNKKSSFKIQKKIEIMKMVKVCRNFSHLIHFKKKE